ncbi:MAG: DUF3108 domain-containing protein [Pseudomonadota bacterium]|nr:DUF3108 domain-containing protein [Pseudomonadota bacterium]
MPLRRHLCLAYFRAFLWIGLMMTQGWFLSTQVATANDAPLTQTWSVRVLGVPVGQFDLKAELNETTYRGRAKFRTKGAAGILARVRFDLQGNGFIKKADLIPLEYREEMETGRRSSTASLSFADGEVRDISGRLNASGTFVDDKALKRPLDPFSAILSAFRPAPAAPSCQLDRTVFDGARVTRLRFHSKRNDGKRIFCHGKYIRVSGYSPAQLQEAEFFPLRLTFDASNGHWRPVRAQVGSLFGPVTLVRKD